jgi:predicted Fe-Mo cluster-binding NifX family protein
MKIMITATKDNLDAPIDPRFGRCHYFIVVDPDTLEYDVKKNLQKNATGGAGVQAAQSVAQAQVDAVITGSVGPNAFETLQAAHIKIFTGASGTVKNAIDEFKKGALQETNTSTVQSHHGMGGCGR